MLADDLTPPAGDDTLIALESVHEELHAEPRGQEEAERDRTGVRRRDLARAEGDPQQVAVISCAPPPSREGTRSALAR